MLECINCERTIGVGTVPDTAMFHDMLVYLLICTRR